MIKKALSETFEQKNRFPHFSLQLFAEDGGEGDSGEGIDGAEPDGSGGDDSSEDETGEKKYSDADLDAIIEKKFAKWQKQQAKKVSEAEKLASRNAEKKSEDRIKDLETKVSEYEQERTHTQMMTQARAILHEEHINISDTLLGSLITDDADSTADNIKEFVSVFRSEVSKAVKEQLKGSAPKTGGTSKITKEEIMKVSNPLERQKLIRENIELFK